MPSVCRGQDSISIGLNKQEFAGSLEGYDAADIRVLLDRALHAALRRQLASGASPNGVLHPQHLPLLFFFSENHSYLLSTRQTAAGCHSLSLTVYGHEVSALSLVCPGSAGACQCRGQTGFGRGAGALVVGPGDLEAALEGFAPASSWGVGRSAAGDGPGPRGWQDVGGLEDVREALQETLELPMRFAKLIAGHATIPALPFMLHSRFITTTYRQRAQSR